MSLQAKLIDSLIGSGLAASLKADGYRRKLRTWHSVADSHIRVVNLQSAPGRFTVNLGVYFPAVRALAGQPPLLSLPKEHECTVRKRIGLLMPRKIDSWWQIDDDVDFAAYAISLNEAWIKYGKPWIERSSNLDQARQELGIDLTTGCVTVAAVCLLCKKRGEAKKAIKVALKHGTIDPKYQQEIRRWATKAGLTI